MVYCHPAEIEACQERADRAERECQRLREIIAQQADNIAYLRRRLEVLEQEFKCSA